MSLRTALQTIGLLTVVYLLFAAFVASGPLGWVVFGTLFAVGLIQIYRGRVRGPRDDAAYCANCGTSVDFDAFEAIDETHPEWDVRHCSECGAPVVPTSERDTETGPVNCTACGAPNDPERTACKHCDAKL